ncbi:unnamed protein product [Closterium sp. NIES-54]
MALLRVLSFDPEGRPVAFDTWHDDLQLYLQSDLKDSVPLFDHVSGAAPAPPATTDVSTRSHWLSRDATARLAIRIHLPSTECAHFGEHMTAQALYDAIVARYSSPATAAIGRLLLPYLFPELSAFASVGGGGGGSDGGDGGSGGGGGGSGGSGGSGGGRAGGGRSGPQRGGPGGGLGQQQQRRSETETPQQLRVWLVQRGEGEGSETCLYVIRTGVRAARTCGKFHTERQCFARLDDAWRAEFGDKVERPRWAQLLQSGVAIFDLDLDVIISAMYALSFSAEGDCYRCVPPDPGIAAAALGASASSTPPGTAPAEALHTFTLDSNSSHYFFRDSTTLTPLPAPVPVRLADPSGGPVVARSSTVLPFAAVPSGSLSGLHLPSFSTNLVSTAALQDAMVTTTTPGGQRVSICTCTRTGRHLATFIHQPRSSLYTLATEPPQVAASAQDSTSGQVAATCSCCLLSHQTLLWHHRLGHPSLPRLRGMHSRLLVSGLPRSLPPLPPSPVSPCLPCIEGRQRATPHSSSFPPTTAPLQTLHVDVWDPALVSGQGRERYFLLVVDDYTRYTTVFPLRSKGEVSAFLIPWIRTVRLQLRERFGQDLPVLRLHSDRGGDTSLLESCSSVASFVLPLLAQCRTALQLLALPAPHTPRSAAACESRPAALPSARRPALQPAPSCPAARASCCLALSPARRPAQQLVSHTALPCSPARRALLPCPACRALQPCASRPAAARTSHLAALRVTPCCSPRVLPYCSPRVALCCPAPRADLPNPGRAALPRSPAPPSRLAATTAAAAARATAAACGGAAGSADGAGGAGGATESAGGGAGAGGAGPTTDRCCLSWPLSRQLQRLGVDSGGRCLSWTTPPFSSFASGFFSEPVQVVEALVFCVLHRGGSIAAALGASESPAALGASESTTALGASESAATLGASEFAAAPDASESAAALGARASPATGPSSDEALHTFTLDSGTSRCFFRDCTALTPLAAPVPVSLADPTGGPVVA